MAKYSDLHLLLEMAIEKYRDNPSDENGDAMVKELKKLFDINAELIAESVQTEKGIMPGGFYAKDGSFYFHLFTSRIHLNNMQGEPIHVKAQDILKLAEDTPVIKGFCLNHRDQQGGIVITLEELSSI